MPFASDLAANVPTEAGSDPVEQQHLGLQQLPAAAKSDPGQHLLSQLEMLQEDIARILSPNSRPPARRNGTAADYAEDGRLMLHWDLVDYESAISGLAPELAPPMARSRRFAVVFVAVKCAQEVLLPTSQHPALGTALTLLTTYHVAFALAYQLGLFIVARCRRRAEELRQKVADRTASRDDLREWGGFIFGVAEWMCLERWFRRSTREFPRPWWCPWAFEQIILLITF